MNNLRQSRLNWSGGSLKLSYLVLLCSIAITAVGQPGGVAQLSPIGSDGCEVAEVTYSLTYETYRIHQVGLTFSNGGAGTLSKQFLNGEFKIDWTSPGTVEIDFSYYEGFEIKSYSGLPVLATYSLIGNPGIMKVKKGSSFISTGSTVEYDTSVTLVSSGSTGDYSFQKCTSSNCPSDSDTNWTTTTATSHSITQRTRFRIKSTSCEVGYSNVFTVNAYAQFNPGTIELPTSDVCDGQSFTLDSKMDASGGRSPIGYQWYGSTNNSTWTAISRDGGASASLPSVSLSGPFRFYKRQAWSDFDESSQYSNTLDLNTLVVQDPLDPGTLDAMTICYNTIPGSIGGTGAGGGAGTYSYKWSFSSDNSTWSTPESGGATYTNTASKIGRLTSDFWVRRSVTASICGGTETVTLKIDVLNEYKPGTLGSINRPEYGTKVKDISLSVSGAYPNSVIYQFCTSGCNSNSNWRGQSNNNTAITGDVWFRAQLRDNTCGTMYTPQVKVTSFDEFFEGTIIAPESNQCETADELTISSGLEASGGSGGPYYQWQYYNGAIWANIPEEPGRPSDEAALKVSVPLKYSRVQRVASSNFGEAEASNEVDLSQVTFAQPLDPGFLIDQTLCPGGTAAEITGVAASEGGGIQGYTWQFRNEGGSWSPEYAGQASWTDVENFASDLNDHLYVRRNVSAKCESGSAEAKITILPAETQVCQLGGVADLISPLTGQLFYYGESSIDVRWGFYPELADASLYYIENNQPSLVSSGIPNANDNGEVRFNWQGPPVLDGRFELLVTNEVRLVEFQATNLEFVERIDIVLQPKYDQLYMIDQELLVEWVGGSSYQPFQLSIINVDTDEVAWQSSDIDERNFMAFVDRMDPQFDYVLRISQSNLREDFPLEVIDTTYPTASQDKNYVKVYQMREETFLPPSHNSDPAGGSIQTIQYFDGLGRLAQTVQQANTSEEALDLVTMTTYDVFGRADKSWLPFAAATGNQGHYVEDAEELQQGYYEDIYPGEGSHAFGETEFEPSPLSRVLAQGSPGSDWSVIGDHKVEYKYLVNDQGEVRKLFVENDQIYYTSNYGAGQLFKNVVLDENSAEQRGESIEFTNKNGEVVLKKVKLDQEGETVHYAQTYYIYDEFGSLRHVVQPQGIEEILEEDNDWELLTDDDFQRRWMFGYRYDKRRRMVAKRVPGADWVYMVYDDRDRLVLTQDGHTRGEPVLPDIVDKVSSDRKVDQYEEVNYYVEPSGSVTFTPGFEVKGSTAVDGEFFATTKSLASKEYFGKVWQFTKYDDLNRPIITGFTEIDTDDITQVVKDFYTGPDANYFDVYDGEEELGGYTNESFPTNITDDDVLTITYYDDYDFAGGETPDEALHLVNGQVTGTMTRILGTDEFVSSVTYYDDRYRPIESLIDNHLDGQDQNFIQYRNKVSGLVKSETFYHEGEEDVEIWRTYGYDHMDRLLVAQQSLALNEPGEFRNIAVNTYDERGQLIEKEIGGRLSSGQQPVQSVDYDYNIRGWLTSINGGATIFDDELDQFGMELRYNQEESILPQFNGNIAAMSWKSRGGDSPAIVQTYEYEYDAASRLKAAAYSGLGDHSVEGLVYDHNGNIQHLTRLQRLGAIDHIIDQLSYTYDKSNQLLAVADAGSTTSYMDEDQPKVAEARDLGFYDGASRSNEYIYDDNGNMTKDFNKGITSIRYNHLNLPEAVALDDGTIVNYLYDAAGVKLRKTVNSGDNGYEVDYSGDVQYKDGELDFVRHAEGRAVYQGSEEAEELEEFSYEYNLTDHLGNVRVVVSDLEQYTYLLTMESENASIEEDQYFALQMGEVRATDAVANSTPGGNEVARLVSGPQQQTAGPFVVIEVQQGNKLDISVDAFYEPSEQPSQSIAAAATLSGLATATNPASGTLEGAAASALGESLNAGPAGLSSNAEAEAPEAYLNYLLMDETFQVTKMGFVRVTEAAAGRHERLSLEGIDIDQAGYLQVWVQIDNEEPGFVINFDDLMIVQRSDFVKQVQDYYPFGLTFNEWTREPENLYKFQGQEEQKETGWFQFKWRNSDPALGRFFNVDPLAEKYLYNSPYAFSENKVVAHIELEGLESLYAPGHGGQKLIRSNFKKQGTSFYFREGGIQVGLHQGFVAVQQEGVAYDEVGKTQFTSRSLGMVGSRFKKGTGVSGVDLGLSFGFKVDSRATFLQASEGLDNSIPLKFGVGMEFSEKSFSMTIGAQAGIAFVSKGDDIVQSVSLSYDQAEVVNDMTGVVLETWEVGGVTEIYDDDENVIGYSGVVTVKDTDGTVINTGVQVFSGAERTSWASQAYIDGVNNLEEDN